MKEKENKRFFRRAALAACLLAGVCSCKKDSGTAEPVMVGTFTAVTENHVSDGKTYLDENHNVFWKTGDRIKVYSSKDYTEGAVFGAYSGGSQSEFEAVQGLYNDFVADGNHYAAVYPVDKCNFTGNDSEPTFTVEIPKTQKYDESWSYSDGANPMVAFSDNTTLSFKNVCGMLRFKLHGIAPVKKISIIAHNNEKLWGTATFKFEDGEPKLVSISNDNSETDTITLNVNEESDDKALKLDGEPREFLILLPAGTCENGFKLRVEDPWGGYWEKDAVGGSENKIERSKIKEMPVVTVIPYVELYDGGTKWATMNIGVTHPWEVGPYYSWGGLTPVYPPSTKCQYNSTVKGDLTDAQDIVCTVYGGGWRMPTITDTKNLCANCDKMVIENYLDKGINVVEFRGRGTYANNVLLLPNGGYYAFEYVTDYNKFGTWWTRTAAGNNQAYCLNSQGGFNPTFATWTYNGFPIRAVK